MNESTQIDSDNTAKGLQSFVLQNSIKTVFFMEGNNLRMISASSEKALRILHPELKEDSYLVLTDELSKTLDKDYFFAYELDENKNFVMNLDKAKEIKKNELRAKRKPLLDALDVEMMRALETQNQDIINDVINRKQKLRDVTELVDALITFEEVKSFSLESA